MALYLQHITVEVDIVACELVPCLLVVSPEARLEVIVVLEMDEV